MKNINQPRPIFSSIRNYFVALLIIAIATLIRALVFGDLGRVTPYVTYYPAVMLAALLGGFNAGLLATVVSTLLCYFWIQRGSLSPVETFAIVLFFISMVIVSMVAEAMRRSKIRAEQSMELLKLKETELQSKNEQLQLEIVSKLKTEDSLRQSEIFLKETQQIAQLGSYTLDIASGTWTSSPILDEFFGIDNSYPHTIEGWSSLMHPEWRELMTNYLMNDIVGLHKRFDKEYKIVRQNDGVERWAHGMGKLEFNATNQPVKMIGTISDVTERRQAEEELRETNAYLENLINYANVPIIVWNPELHITRFNHAFELLSGRSESEVIGQPVQILFPPATVKQSMSLIRETITGEKWNTVEIDIQHQDGSIRTLLWNSVTLFSLDGVTPIAIIAQGHEITDRKKAEITLQMQTERLRNLHIIDQAILQAIESPEEVVQTALEHIRSLLHCQRASVGIFDLEKKDVRIFAADVDGKTIVKTGNILTEEIYGVIEILRQNRIEIVEDMSKVPMPSATNLILQAEGIQSSINVALISELEMYGVLNVGWENPKSINQEEIDIASEAAIQITIGIEKARLLKETKRYALELEDRVIQRTAQLNAVNDELESFSYSVSHDLRAPLRGIDGFSNILLEDYSDKVGTEGKRLLNVIRDSTKKMGQLIDDLLSFSRIGKRELDKSDVDMKTLAHSIYSELTSDEERKKIVFSISNIPHTNGDPPLVRQLWINSISNAIKFTKNTAQPMIEIGSKEEKGKEWYFVKDNGIGFDMKYYNKLFGVFQRLHSKAEYEGTGIGLSIAKRIVNKHGGDIWAESELNVGTTIWFTI